MKKFLKSKKALTAAALSLVLAIGGMTYAWFITPPVNGGGDVTVGTMILQAEDDLVFKNSRGTILSYLEPDDAGTAYYAGLSITSLGNIGQIAKVDFGIASGDGIIIPPYERDANGFPVYEKDADGKWVPKLDPTGVDKVVPFAAAPVALGVDSSKMNYLSDVLWLQDPATGGYYVVFYNDTTDGSVVDITANDAAYKLKITDPDAFGIEYMGAKIKCSLTVKGSQIHPTAIQQAFGIDMNDLVGVDPSMSLFSLRGASNYDVNLAKWNAIVAEFAE